MRGFTRAKYERIMDKLYLDRPMHTVDFVFRTTTTTPHNVCTVNNVPCIIDIKSITSTYDKTTSIYFLIKHQDHYLLVLKHVVLSMPFHLKAYYFVGHPVKFELPYLVQLFLE